MFASYQRPLTLTVCLSPLGSVDDHALQIDELKGTKPTEKINLSHKKLGVASAIIIASCIKENCVLKELKCAAAPEVLAFVSAPPNTPSHRTHTVTRSLRNNGFDDTTKKRLKEATSAKNGFELIL